MKNLKEFIINENNEGEHISINTYWFDKKELKEFFDYIIDNYDKTKSIDIITGMSSNPVERYLYCKFDNNDIKRKYISNLKK